MAEILVIRHAEADYPNDNITEFGKKTAEQRSGEFQGYKTVACSPKIRAIQTAQALGYNNPYIDHRLREYAAKDIRMPTAEEWLQIVNSTRWDELVTFGQVLLSAIVEYGQQDDAMLVTHNAVMSATFRILTGEINPFACLSGYKITLESGTATEIKKI